MKEEVRGITREGSMYWAATSGGMFGWNSSDGSYQLFTNAEGLQTINLTAVGVDVRGSIWIGAANGVIHVFSQRNRSWQYIPDIANANQTNKRINSLTVLGDTVLICTEFGLSVFRSSRFEFGDTYSQFGSLQGNIRVSVSSAVIFGDSLWISVTDGQSHFVAVASLSAPNLLPPESWSLRSVGIPAVAPKQLAVFGAKLYAATNSGLYAYDAGVWTAVALGGQDIIGISPSPTLLSIVTSTQAFTLDVQGNLAQTGGTLPFPSLSVTCDENGLPAIGTRDGGILQYTTDWTSYAPGGPNSSSFFSVTVTSDGTVWGASGPSNGKGFYRYNGRDWKSFTLQNSGLPTDNYYHVSPGCNGSVWASSAGRGMAEIPNGWDRVDSSYIYGRNVGMIGIPSDSNFLVMTTAVCDGRGNTWMSVNTALDTRIMAVMKPDRTWITLPVKLGTSRISSLISNLSIDRSFAVDAYDNLWGVANRANFPGIFSLGNRGAVDDSIEHFLSASDGLPSNEVTTIVADRENNIWVGTDRGIGIILDPLRPKRSGGISSYVPLRGTVINTIAVDALNQKWVGTPEGVVVLSSDGTQQIGSYTVGSTGGKLISDDIKSIAIDDKSGTVYFGTLSGLASLTTAAAAPKASFDELAVAPNPFIIPATSELTVEGLVENSTLKVLSIDGRLVRQVKTPGGRIGFWDGKDERGNLVSSGVYVIVASSDRDDAVAKAKVAVIRR
jgi:ligand-binding sensor domain-containing protein